MKNYEWSNKHTSVRKCTQCGKTLEFADMKCPHCGADARSEKREYRPRLSSSDIQSTVRDREGAPHKPQGSYSFDKINIIGIIFLALALVGSAIAGIAVGMAAGVIEGILIGVISAVCLICSVSALKIQMLNTAKAAENNERIALGVEYQIQQMNELITTYNRDKEIDGENSEVFAKLLLRISKLEEAQKNNLEELTNIVGALSDKLTKLPTAVEEIPENITEDIEEETTEEIPEEIIEESAETAEPTEKISEESTEPENTESDEVFEPEETLEIEEIIKEAKEIEEEKEQEEAPAFDARSAGTEDWDDGFFDKEESKTEEDNKETEKNPTSRLDAFLDDDDEL